MCKEIQLNIDHIFETSSKRVTSLNKQSWRVNNSICGLLETGVEEGMHQDDATALSLFSQILPQNT